MLCVNKKIGKPGVGEPKMSFLRKEVSRIKKEISETYERRNLIISKFGFDISGEKSPREMKKGKICVIICARLLHFLPLIIGYSQRKDSSSELKETYRKRVVASENMNYDQNEV
ncbi:hypothetical protein CAEBREN_10649 [Caenorhabditis brenneri]|uniref:Uncharacterized protein n=1 Tax=Caenorhabditis brenneri TaxID=135651 RepID=G0MRD5_CAEBE|nr:hypothetical protein CAEBREN_10649 [Caenorhabditis brenneri]